MGAKETIWKLTNENMVLEKTVSHLQYKHGTAQARIAELEVENKSLKFDSNAMRELLQHFVLGYRQGRDLSAVYMDARTLLGHSA